MRRLVAEKRGLQVVNVRVATPGVLLSTEVSDGLTTMDEVTR